MSYMLCLNQSMKIALAPKVNVAPLTRSKPRPLKRDMILTNQDGLLRRNPSWRIIESVVRDLNAGYGNSFCCLQSLDKSYVQTLRGFNGWHLEWRVTTSPTQYVHLRAAYPGSSEKQVELKKHDFVSDGEHRDLMNEDEVIDAFRAFHNGGGPLGWLVWRELAI